MVSRFISVVFLCCFCIAIMAQDRVSEKAPVDYVDPYIGTGFHGHVFMGANLPFGAVQLGPVNLSEGWDWCSGYHISDSTIIGFAHTHLSGTGIGDLGDILVMPTTGPIMLSKGKAENPEAGYLSKFSHVRESAAPGYYSVQLDRYGIGAELTTTERTGLHRYEFPESPDAHILLDLVEGIGWDRPASGYIRVINDSMLTGYRFSRGWAADQRIYFAAVFSKPFQSISLFDRKKAVAGMVAMGDSIQAVANFTTTANETILLKVAISPVSMENALLNMRTEIPAWDFDGIKAQARTKWNEELSKVTIQVSQDSVKQIFYTAAYHTMIAPSIFNDVNADYYGTDKAVHPHASFTNLTTFSLWDTYRACNEWFTITQPARVSDMVNSMLAIYKQQGRLPVWHLMGNETNTMPGNSAIQVVADAVLKNIAGFDTSLAYEAMKATTMLDLRGLRYVREQGFIPADSMKESVAMGMEYAIGDACLALVAKRMGLQEDYAYFQQRGKNYRHYFDPSVKFVRGRMAADQWREPFSPFVARHGADDFAEGNSWQYSWLVPQDVEGLMSLMGGEKAFAKKLDSLFTVKGDMGDEASNDITGLIGQYAHGNEPSHHIAYLYAYTGQPWKTAEKIRQILSSMYSSKPEGLSGNEDVGQMSAWYLFSAIGLYPVHPAGGIYVFGSPLVDDAVISLPKGKKFHVQVKNNSPKNIYIQRILLNGKPYDKSYMMHTDIIQGADLQIEMGSKPSRKFGIAAAARPFSPM